MKKITIFILLTILIHSCSSSSSRTLASSQKLNTDKAHRSNRVVKFPSGNVSIDRLENILTEELDRPVAISDVKYYRNVITFTSSLLHGDHNGYRISLHVENDYNFNCRIYEHNPGGRKVLNMNCKGDKEDIVEVFEKNSNYLHINLDLVLE